MEKGIGIFGLSANPFHNGHLSIISEIASFDYIARLDLITTYKPTYKKCLPYEQRLQMCCLGIFDQGLSNVLPRDIRKQYTYQLIKHYKKEETDLPLYLFVGDDWDISTWKNPEYIKENCIVKQYRRKDYLPISSTIIREKIKNKRPINGLVPENVLNYIKENNLYV
jgi:nicotinate-nucleotide adenylyltransferase